MRLIHTVVSNSGFRDPASNPVRWALFDRLILLASEKKVQLLLLPAGFLTAEQESELPEFIEELGRRADRAGVGVLGGIDIEGSSTMQRGRTKAATDDNGKLPYHGFAAGLLTIEQPECHPWRQTSTNNSNAWDVEEEDVPGAERVIRVGDVRIAVLLCGELFSERARDSMSALGVDLVVDLGHSGMGTGLIPAMIRLATDGKCAVAHAQHLRGLSGSLHYVDAQGNRSSTPVGSDNLLEEGDLWLRWATRDL